MFEVEALCSSRSLTRYCAVFDARKVSEFLREYARYKNEVEGMRKEITSMTADSFKVCIL